MVQIKQKGGTGVDAYQKSTTHATLLKVCAGSFAAHEIGLQHFVVL